MLRYVVHTTGLRWGFFVTAVPILIIGLSFLLSDRVYDDHLLAGAEVFCGVIFLLIAAYATAGAVVGWAIECLIRLVRRRPVSWPESKRPVAGRGTGYGRQRRWRLPFSGPISLLRRSSLLPEGRSATPGPVDRSCAITARPDIELGGFLEQPGRCWSFGTRPSRELRQVRVGRWCCGKKPRSENSPAIHLRSSAPTAALRN